MTLLPWRDSISLRCFIDHSSCLRSSNLHLSICLLIHRNTMSRICLSSAVERVLCVDKIGDLSKSRVRTVTNPLRNELNIITATRPEKSKKLTLNSEIAWLNFHRTLFLSLCPTRRRLATKLNSFRDTGRFTPPDYKETLWFSTSFQSPERPTRRRHSTLWSRTQYWGLPLPRGNEKIKLV